MSSDPPRPASSNASPKQQSYGFGLLTIIGRGSTEQRTGQGNGTGIVAPGRHN